MKIIITIVFGMLLLISKAFAQSESEPNNHFSKANTYTINSSVNLALTPSGDIDIFKLRIDKGGVLELKLNNIPKAGFYGLPVEFSVYPEDTTKIVYHYYHSGNPYYPNDISAPIVVPAGIYFIKVKCDNASSNSAQTFQLNVALDTVDNCEYNNNFGTACTVPINTIFSEKIHGYNLGDTSNANAAGLDKDFYKIYIPRSGILSINMQNIPNVGFYGVQIETFVYSVLDTAKVLAHYHHSGNPYYPNTVNYPVLLKQGEYYIKVQADDNFSQSSTAYSTSFNLDTTELCEYNNQFSTACQAALNTPLSEKIYGYNLLDTTEGNVNGVDVDFYKIVLLQDTTLTVNIHQIPNVGFYGLRLEFFIYKSDMTTLVAHYYHPGNPYYPNDISYPIVLAAGTYYVKVKTDDYSQSSTPFNIMFSVSNVLPLKLLSFQANLNNKQVGLLWQTASEFNTSHFNIQRSITGSSFYNIGTVTATSNSNTTREYSFNDIKPFQTITYYRLQIVDSDGHIEYSNVIAVKNSKGNNLFDVFPNPVNDNLFLKVENDRTENATIKILDVHGRLIQQHSLTITKGTTFASVNTSTLRKGIYILTLQTTTTHKQIIVKR